MLCGWIPQSEWTDAPSPGWGAIDGCPLVPPSDRQREDGKPAISVCPGYSSRLPEVHEIARAWGWFDKGQLQVRYPDGLSSHHLDLVELFHQSNASAQDHAMKEQ